MGTRFDCVQDNRIVVELSNFALRIGFDEDHLLDRNKWESFVPNFDDAARGNLAAQAPAMARMLIQLVKELSPEESYKRIAILSLLADAGVLTDP